MDMWLWFACGSALFAGITAVLSKIGVRGVHSHLATAIRTTVVLAAAWALVLATGRGALVLTVAPRTLAVLALSGLATGASWLCYFRALQLGTVSRVAAVDKSSTILSILLAALLLGEPLGLRVLLAIAILGAGTALMLAPPAVPETGGTRGWFPFAALSAVFAALTAIFGKLSVQALDPNVATAIRTVFVLACAWGMVLLQGLQRDMHKIDRRCWLFLVLSGLATGLSWLCYYQALQTGRVGAVVPIDKLSIVVTVMFSRAFLHEKLVKRAYLGLFLVVVGTLLLL